MRRAPMPIRLRVDALRALCEERGVSVSALSVSCGISRETLAGSIRYGSAVFESTAEKVCLHLGVSFDELFSIEEGCSGSSSAHALRDRLNAGKEESHA